MPILRCEECEYTFAYLGKALGIRCPNGCGHAFDPVNVHVDVHLVTESDQDMIDGRYTDIDRRGRTNPSVASG